MHSNYVESLQTTAQPPVELLETPGFIAEDTAVVDESGSTWKMDLNLSAGDLKRPNAMDPLLVALRRIPGVEPNIPRIEAVLYELYFNAVDHGVLGLNSAMKANAEGFMKFYHRREDALAHLTNGYVRIHLAYFASSNGGTLLISMQDSGNGFDHARYFGFSPDQAQKTPRHQVPSPMMPVSLQPHGRGLKLAHSLCESLRFFGCGNQVVARIHWKTAH